MTFKHKQHTLCVFNKSTVFFVHIDIAFCQNLDFFLSSFHITEKFFSLLVSPTKLNSYLVGLFQLYVVHIMQTDLSLSSFSSNVFRRDSVNKWFALDIHHNIYFIIKKQNVHTTEKVFSKKESEKIFITYTLAIHRVLFITTFPFIFTIHSWWQIVSASCSWSRKKWGIYKRREEKKNERI